MRRFIVGIALIALVALSSCSQIGGQFESIALVNPSAPPTAVETVLDTASLADALRAAGADVSPSGRVALTFMHGDGTLLRVGDQRVQVYEYANEAEARQDAARFSQDGAWVSGDVGATLVNWFATPHLYRASRVITVYVGDSAPTLALLEGVLGAPFAGGANPYRTVASVPSAD